MRSAAHFRGHPLHPALVPFPIAFLSGAFVADLLSLLRERPELWATGGHLSVAGIATALLAGSLGAVDWARTVPPASSGRTRATRHALVNLAATALFAGAWLLRTSPEEPTALLVVSLEGVGTVLLAVGGWMGGTLTFRNQIGVDHRYAGAGKWKEATLRGDGGGPLKAAEKGELEVDQMKLLHVDGRRIVLARTPDGWAAFDDRCPHRGGSLAGGVMICGTVLCPWHGSQFDGATGEVRAGPAEQPIATYEVEEREDGIWLAP